MSLITINTAVINYGAGSTDCQCIVAVDVPTIGLTYFPKQVSLSSAALGPDWTDADLCAAVATALSVDVSDVSVAAPAPVVDVSVAAPAPVVTD